jgi:hypothetical protein
MFRTAGAAMSEKRSKVERAGGCGKFQVVRQSKIEKGWTHIGCDVCEGWEWLEGQLRSSREGMITDTATKCPAHLAACGCELPRKTKGHQLLAPGLQPPRFSRQR